MIAEHYVRMDLSQQILTPQVEVVQGDTCSNILKLEFTHGPQTAALPPLEAVLIQYRSIRRQGAYDTLPDGNRAWQIDGNCLLVTLVPQVCGTPGPVELTIQMQCRDDTVKNAQIRLNVLAASAGSSIDSPYINITRFLPQPAAAQPGHYLRVKEVDGQGNVTAVVATPVEVRARDAVLYTEQGLTREQQQIARRNIGAQLASLEVTLMKLPDGRYVASHSSAQIQDALDAGYDALIRWEHCIYRPGQATQDGYVFQCLEASETALVAHQIRIGFNRSVKFVTCPEQPKKVCHVTCQLSHVRWSNPLHSVTEGSPYAGTLTADEGYALGAPTVTMGSRDITAQVLDGDTVRIPSVTGDVVISCTAEIKKA